MPGIGIGLSKLVRQGSQLKQFTDYVARVLADSGLIKDRSVTSRYMQMAKSNGMLDSIRFAWLGEAGYKQRTSGINTFWTKLYSLRGTNDATQTTSTNQPYLSGNIAPNEKWCLKNPNGGDEYMTHPTISFAANEAWSVTTVITPYGSNAGVNSRILGNDTASKTRIELAPNGGTLYVYGEAANGSIAIPNRKGKRTVFHVTYNGAGVVSVSINATAIGTININDSFVFNTINRASGSQYFFGENSGVMIRAGELTLSQKQSEANFLRSIYPEIPSVTIGSQVWATSTCEMVATPMGNLIANVTANANVEKITNAADRDFSSDTVFWTKGSVAWSISGGVANCNTSTSTESLYSTSLVASGKWVKFTFTITSITSGGIHSRVVGRLNGIERTTVGTFTDYLFVLSTDTQGLGFQAGTNTIASIDNVSIQEVGWSDSQNLYDYIYANTSGTAEQKTYAAVKAAGMWCHYNNDPANGAIYGKLYNWFAVKLLQMDIDYYNAANPTTPWGWRVPTQADFTTLQTYLGGASVAGGKLKMIGTGYWSPPNTGATNETGFSALGGGRRSFDGTWTNYLAASERWTITETTWQSAVRAREINFNSASEVFDGIKAIGHSLRLIKN